MIYIAIFFLIAYGTPKILSSLLGTQYPIASITSSSMWPALKEGDVVFIRGINGKADLRIGDIVVYRNENGFTIHRIEKLGESELTTKGDANNVSDLPVKYTDIVGKAVETRGKIVRIPYLGRLSTLLNR